MKRRIKKINKPLQGHIQLSGSKSISNRLLIIQALSDTSFELSGLASADDTQVLQQVLASTRNTYDVHHAGTSYRFLCSYLCLLPGEQILTGSDRMKERPIGPLVEALRTLGASIEYLEKEGYPPLKIGEAKWKKLEHPLEIDASVSSQFISSLLLIAPQLPYGLNLRLVGNLVSRPYLEMTLALMKDFGISNAWEEDTINIKPQEYKGRDYVVEADWSAASYYFGLVSLVPGSKISLGGLFEQSTQGDAGIVEMMEPLGVGTRFEKGEIILEHTGVISQQIEQNFILQPDLAQTICVTAAGLGVDGLYSGLQTLKVKETDRIAALQNELMKFQVFLSKLPSKFSKKAEVEYYIQQGKAVIDDVQSIPTYKDHRMAMSFAILAGITDIIIEESDVVSKSYPGFWKDLGSLGVEVSN